jgi:hypothetical protein
MLFSPPPYVVILTLEEHGYTHDLMWRGRNLTRLSDEAGMVRDMARTLEDPAEVLPFIEMLEEREISWESDDQREMAIAKCDEHMRVCPGTDEDDF